MVISFTQSTSLTAAWAVSYTHLDVYKRQLTYNENEIRRIEKRGFDIAMKRRKKVTSVDLSLIHISF